MRWVAYIFLFLLPFNLNGQVLDSELDLNFIWPKSSKDHFSKKLNPDSISGIKRAEEYRVRPHLNYSLSGGLSSAESSGVIHAEYINAGFNLVKNNVSLDLSGEFLQGEFGAFMADFIDSTGVISGFNVARKNELGYLSHRITGNLNWQASKHFNIELGNGTNFWGNGYRSLVLGENAAPYPYLKLTTDVWRIKYVNLFAQQRGFTENLDIKKARIKYSALHAIDFKVSESFSFTIFEAVIWQNSDSLSNRGFEANYLNPIIFYRPVEFSQGSADNVLLGVAARLRVEDNFLWYGQLFLDEFLLSAVRQGSGWWANKLGAQIGVKAFNFIPGINAYSEFNMARPFTYTHGSALQNYGHLNQSLAHPLGTNFMEWSSGLEYEFKKWVCSARFNWALYGRDQNGNNYGGDIFRSYTNPFRSLGNYIGQGNTHHSYFMEFNAYRALNNKNNLWLTMNYAARHLKSSFSKESEQFFRIGIASNISTLINRNRDVYVPNFVQDF